MSQRDHDMDEEKTCCHCSSILIRHGVHQDRGRRTVMEDKHVIYHRFNDLVQRALVDKALEAPEFFPLTHQSVYVGLFDGHAGVAAAEFCKRYLHENIARSVPFSRNMAEAMVKGFLLTDRQFLDTARLSNEESGSVCVSAIYSASDSTLTIAHAGDSRAVLCRGGQAILLTDDHKPTSLEERVRVEKNGGTVEWDMLNGVLDVSRAIGDFDRDLGLKTKGLTAQPETQLVNIDAADEFVILACDGLWDVIGSEEAVQFVRSHLFAHDSVDAASEFLVQEAIRRQSDDNITVIVIGFQKLDAVSKTKRIVPTDAVVDQLPAFAVIPSSPLISPAKPPDRRRRPKMCAKGLAHVQGLLG
ncbi:PPM-type phosphatase domain-containing protein [Plasmodiophora brassicae]